MDSSASTSFWLHEWRVDPRSGRMTRGRESVQLGSQQVQVLLLLTRNPRLTLSHREIEETVCASVPPAALLTSAAADLAPRCISQLRAALGDDARQPRFIQTIPRRGYRLIAPIRNEVATAEVEQPEPRPITEIRSVAGDSTPSAPPAPSARLDRIAPLRILNRLGLTKICIGAVLLLGLGSIWWLNERTLAVRAGDHAAQIAQFMENVFAADDAQRLPGQPETAQALRDRALRRLDADLQSQPQVRMQMLETIARSYVHQQQNATAVPALEEVLRLRRSLNPQPQPQTAATLATLGEALQGMNRFGEAQGAYREALDILRATHRQPSRDFAATFGRLGTLDIAQGNYRQGLRILDSSLQQMRETQGLYHTDTAGILVDISQACGCIGDLRRADLLVQEAQRIYQSSTAQLNPDRLAADNTAGHVLLLQQRFDEAEVVLGRTLVARRQLYGPRGAPIAETLNLLASVRNGQGRLEEAEELKLAALDALDDLGGAASLQRATVQLSLATLLLRSQQFARSEQLLRAAIGTYDAALPADHLSRISAEHYLAEALLEQKKYREAESTLQTVMQRMRRASVPQWRVSRSQSTLGEVLYRQGKTQAARPLLLASNAQLAADPTAKQTAKDKAQQRVTTLLGKQTLWASASRQP